MDKARLRPPPPALCDGDTDRAAAMAGAGVLYAKEWGTTLYYGDAEADSRLRSELSDWCVRERWFAARCPMPSSCIACPCAAMSRWRTRS